MCKLRKLMSRRTGMKIKEYRDFSTELGKKLQIVFLIGVSTKWPTLDCMLLLSIIFICELL